MNKKKKYISITTLIFTILVLGIILLKTNNIDSNNIKEIFKKNIDISISTNKTNATLKEEKQPVKNKDIIGRIKIPGTSIDYDLVQTTNNEYYLDHSTDGEKDYKGSIFMDYRNTTYDRKLLIYGHNSKTLKNVPFHDLEKYLNKKFYNNNKTINLTLNNEESTWEIFSVFVVEGNDNTHMKITFNDKEWIEHINWMKKNSIYDTGVEVGVDDKIVTLQTCYYKPKDSYLIVNAKKNK